MLLFQAHNVPACIGDTPLHHYPISFLRQYPGLNNLENALNKGFIGEELNSMEELAPKLLVNNTDNGEKVLTTIKHSLAKCDEFWLSAAFITASGVSTIINIFQELEERSINGKILTSQYLNFTEPVALKRLSGFKCRWKL